MIAAFVILTLLMALTRTLQMQIMAKLTPGQRMMAMAQESAFGHALLRGAFRTRFPDLSLHEINMMMLRYIEWQGEREY